MHHFLHNRMSSSLDIDHAPLVQFGPHVETLLRNDRQGCIDIGPGDDRRSLLDPAGLPRQMVTDLDEKLVFQVVEFILGIQDGVGKLCQLFCCITLRVSERLSSYIIIRHLILK